MNGDSYMSRGMASTSTLPRIRKHETDPTNQMATDSGRYGPSRDHYVSSATFSLQVEVNLIPTPRLLEMIVVTETETETVMDIEVENDGAHGHLGIETKGRLGAKWK